MATKKHGWGACNALVVIFDAGFANMVGLEDSFEKVTSTLIHVVDHANVVNDKVFLAASVALQSLIRSLVIATSAQPHRTSDVIIPCVTASIAVRFDFENQHQLNERVVNELDALLMKYLCQPLLVAEACAIIHSAKVSSAHLRLLYKWMVEKDCPAGAFSVVSVALRKSGAGLDDELDIEQLFASQTAVLSLTDATEKSEDEL